MTLGPTLGLSALSRQVLPKVYKILFGDGTCCLSHTDFIPGIIDPGVKSGHDTMIGPTRLESVKPRRLNPGDTVAVLSPSWGGPGRFPKVYELGVRNLKARFDLRVKEYPTTKADPGLLYDNPKMRAEDVNNPR